MGKITKINHYRTWYLSKAKEQTDHCLFKRNYWILVTWKTYDVLLGLILLPSFPNPVVIQPKICSISGNGGKIPLLEFLKSKTTIPRIQSILFSNLQWFEKSLFSEGGGYLMSQRDQLNEGRMGWSAPGHYLNNSKLLAKSYNCAFS